MLGLASVFRSNLGSSVLCRIRSWRCSLQGSPGSKDGGLELWSRVADAAERNKIWYRGRLWVRPPIAGLAG